MLAFCSNLARVCHTDWIELREEKSIEWIVEYAVRISSG